MLQLVHPGGNKMSEKNFWQYLRRKMKQSGWHVSRHEDSVTLGIPDISFGIDGIGGWIELKYLKNWPKQKNTKVKIHHLTMLQCKWLYSRGLTSGNCWIFVQIEKDYLLYPWNQAYCLRNGDWTKAEMFENAYGHWKNKLNIDEFIIILKS